MPTSYDPPVITDFGAARLGEPGQKHTGDAMPGVFRAPEIIAEMEWDSQIDIWSVGVMVRINAAFISSYCRLNTQIWNLLEDDNLFRPFKDGYLNDELHFAQMVALMGPPPKQLLERSDRCSKYWDSEGTVVHATDAALF